MVASFPTYLIEFFPSGRGTERQILWGPQQVSTLLWAVSIRGLWWHLFWFYSYWPTAQARGPSVGAGVCRKRPERTSFSHCPRVRWRDPKVLGVPAPLAIRVPPAITHDGRIRRRVTGNWLEVIFFSVVLSILCSTARVVPLRLYHRFFLPLRAGSTFVWAYS